MKYIKQINNLKIYLTEWTKYCIMTPHKIIIEDRMTLEQAENFCRNTLDFTTKRGVAK